MTDPKTLNDMFVKQITGDDIEDMGFFSKGQVSYWLKRCKNCGERGTTGHVDGGKCLFQSTQFLAFTEEEARALASENTNPMVDMLKDQLKQQSFARQIMPVKPVPTSPKR